TQNIAICPTPALPGANVLNNATLPANYVPWHSTHAERLWARGLCTVHLRRTRVCQVRCVCVWVYVFVCATIGALSGLCGVVRLVCVCGCVLVCVRVRVLCVDVCVYVCVYVCV